MTHPDRPSTTEHDERLLTAALDRVAAGPASEPPEVARLVGVAQRARARRRTQMVAAAVVLVGGVGLGTTLVLGSGDGLDRPATVAQDPGADDTSSSSPALQPAAYALDPTTLADDGLVDVGPTDGDPVTLGADGVLHVDDDVDLGDAYGRVVTSDGTDRLAWAAVSYTSAGDEAWFIGRGGDDPTSVTLPALRPTDGGDPFRDWIERQAADGFLSEVAP